MKARGLLFLMLVALASPAAARGQGRIFWTLTDHGVTSVTKGGRELLVGRGYYLTAACAGNDTNPDERLYSLAVEEEDPECTCECVPYSMTFTKLKKNRVRAHIEIGPLRADYSIVSMVLELGSADAMRRAIGALPLGATYVVNGASSELRMGPAAAGSSFAYDEDLVVN